MKLRFGIIAWMVMIFSLGLYSCDSTSEGVFSGETEKGVTRDEIVVGSSLALGGHAGYLGTQTLHGAMSYINHINEQGGVHGRRIKIISYDDGYDPPRCLVNTQKLIVSDRVFALFCFVGTPTTVKIIPLVEEAEIPLLGMFTGAHILRDIKNPWLINVRASYYQETGAAVKYLVEKLGKRKIAVFYQYDAYGFDGLRGTELALKGYGLLPVATGTYIRGTLKIDEGLEKIRESGAEAVVMIGTYDPCAKFIRESRSTGFEPVFYNLSFVGADELARKLGKDGEGVIVTQVVPPPSSGGADLKGVRDYISYLKKYYPGDTPNFAGLEGYVNAMVLVEGLSRAGRDLTRKGFLSAIESIKDFDPGIANTLSFGPDDHQGLDRVYFTEIKNGRFELMEP